MQFGIYLVRRGLISPEQFVDAVEQQLQYRVPIGELAVEACYISMKQVFQILGIQSATRQKFGAIAVELGYLTPSQVGELLAIQDSRDVPFGEVLVGMGALSRECLEAELQRYRESFADAGARNVLAGR